MARSEINTTQGHTPTFHAKVYPRCVCSHPLTMHGEAPDFKDRCDSAFCECKGYTPSRPIVDHGQIA